MNICDPIQPLSRCSQKLLFGVFLGLSLILMVIFGATGKPLITKDAPYGIVSFELAGRVEDAETVLSGWDGEARVRAGFGLGLDFLFIPVYIASLSLGCTLSSGSIERRSWPLEGIVNLLLWGVCLAGLLDIIENVSLLVTLFGKVSRPWPQVAAVCAVIKFSLIFLALVYAMYGGVVSLIIRENPDNVK